MAKIRCYKGGNKCSRILKGHLARLMREKTTRANNLLSSPLRFGVIFFRPDELEKYLWVT